MEDIERIRREAEKLKLRSDARLWVVAMVFIVVIMLYTEFPQPFELLFLVPIVFCGYKSVTTLHRAHTVVADHKPTNTPTKQ